MPLLSLPLDCTEAVTAVRVCVQGRTALMLAVLEGHAEVAKMLLEAGLSPDVKSKNVSMQSAWCGPCRYC